VRGLCEIKKIKRNRNLSGDFGREALLERIPTRSYWPQFYIQPHWKGVKKISPNLPFSAVRRKVAD
jgi:hypothetical protein